MTPAYELDHASERYLRGYWTTYAGRRDRDAQLPHPDFDRGLRAGRADREELMARVRRLQNCNHVQDQMEILT